ncbi:hypothetical protein AYI68_g3983 [Smittium mucronatum]|uniref:Uncharacterized protein n=1 Tax=Smittium mucronatum TaxID=133383 RepID=A0A1R0GYD9_9FUNG|nr:hypothetical protein AYI68_g3983 [Smittium mucronatum]
MGPVESVRGWGIKFINPHNIDTIYSEDEKPTQSYNPEYIHSSQTPFIFDRGFSDDESLHTSEGILHPSNDFELEGINSDQSQGVFLDVSQEYINHLRSRIDVIRELINSEIPSNSPSVSGDVQNNPNLIINSSHQASNSQENSSGNNTSLNINNNTANNNIRDIISRIIPEIQPILELENSSIPDHASNFNDDFTRNLSRSHNEIVNSSQHSPDFDSHNSVGALNTPHESVFSASNPSPSHERFNSPELDVQNNPHTSFSLMDANSGYSDSFGSSESGFQEIANNFINTPNWMNPDVNVHIFEDFLNQDERNQSVSDDDFSLQRFSSNISDHSFPSVGLTNAEYPDFPSNNYSLSNSNIDPSQNDLIMIDDEGWISAADNVSDYEDGFHIEEGSNGIINGQSDTSFGEFQPVPANNNDLYSTSVSQLNLNPHSEDSEQPYGINTDSGPSIALQPQDYDHDLELSAEEQHHNSSNSVRPIEATGVWNSDDLGLSSNFIPSHIMRNPSGDMRDHSFPPIMSNDLDSMADNSYDDYGYFDDEFLESDQEDSNSYNLSVDSLFEPNHDDESNLSSDNFSSENLSSLSVRRLSNYITSSPGVSNVSEYVFRRRLRRRLGSDYNTRSAVNTIDRISQSGAAEFRDLVMEGSDDMNDNSGLLSSRSFLRGARSISLKKHKIRPPIDPLLVVYSSQSHIYLLNTEKESNPIVSCLERVVSRFDTRHNYDLLDYDRLCFLEELNDCGIVLVASQSGLVSIVSLQKTIYMNGEHAFSLRLSSHFPTPEQSPDYSSNTTNDRVRNGNHIANNLNSPPPNQPLIGMSVIKFDTFVESEFRYMVYLLYKDNSFMCFEIFVEKKPENP